MNKKEKQKSAEIQKAISDLPICSEGKESVTKLIIALGHKLTSPDDNPKIQIGTKVSRATGRYVVAHTVGNIYLLINIGSGLKWTEGVPAKDPSNLRLSDVIGSSEVSCFTVTEY